MSSVRSVLSSTSPPPPRQHTGPLPLHRRLLFPQLPPTVPLPPILPDALPELNEELYDFLALALRAYITPWWSRMTRYDRGFVPHVGTILVYVIRALAQRVQTARDENRSLSVLLLFDVPTLLRQHYMDLRTAQAKLGTSYASGGAYSLAQLFHHAQPHMAIDASGRVDAVYVRTLLDHVLRVCLPVEDFESEAECAIIKEVLVKIVLVDVMPKIVQPWFVYKVLLNLLHVEKTFSSTDQARTQTTTSTRQFPSLHTLLVSFLSTLQFISSLGLVLTNLYKQARQTFAHFNEVSSMPKVKTRSEKAAVPEVVIESAPGEDYAACILDLLSEALTLKERAASRTTLGIVEQVVALGGPFLNRILPHFLETHVLTEQTLLMTLRSVKGALFPNGYPGQAMVEPPLEEQQRTKEELVRRLQNRVPGLLGQVLLGATPETRRETMERLLEPLDEPECALHLLLFLLDAIFLVLFPELASASVNSSPKAGDAGLVDEQDGAGSGKSSRTSWEGSINMPAFHGIGSGPASPTSILS